MSAIPKDCEASRKRNVAVVVAGAQFDARCDSSNLRLAASRRWPHGSNRSWTIVLDTAVSLSRHRRSGTTLMSRLQERILQRLAEMVGLSLCSSASGRSPVDSKRAEMALRPKPVLPPQRRLEEDGKRKRLSAMMSNENAQGQLNKCKLTNNLPDAVPVSTNCTEARSMVAKANGCVSLIRKTFAIDQSKTRSKATRAPRSFALAVHRKASASMGRSQSLLAADIKRTAAASKDIARMKSTA